MYINSIILSCQQFNPT